MKRITKKFILSLFLVVLLSDGLIFVSLPLPGHIPILMYHYIYPKEQVGTSTLNVSVDKFRRQMWFLKTFGFRTISLDEFYAIKTGKQKARGREIVVTFDDGHFSYLKYALPIMERYHIQSVNFLIWNHLVQKIWPDDMTLKDAEQLSHHPLVTFGSHSLSHPNLSEISREQAKTEIVQSKENLEKALGKKVYYFCYPSGAFDQEVLQMVKAANYRLAFTTARKHLNGYPETLYSIARIKVHPEHNLFIFWLNISGIIYYMNRIDNFFHQLTGHKLGDKLTIYESEPKTM